MATSTAKSNNRHMQTFLLLLQFLFTFAQGQGPGSDDRINFTISENINIGFSVGFIPTRTGFTYRLHENPNNLFALDANTGELTTAAEIDRENLPSNNNPIKLVVLSSKPVYPIDVIVQVLDENDNAPVFAHPGIVAISFSEAAHNGTQWVLQTATDADIGINDVTQKYTIVSGNQDNKFDLLVISETSKPLLYVVNRVQLDREDQAFYQLNISAQDGGNPPKFGYLLVNITVTDINDNPPIFDHSDYTASINESSPAQTVVTQVRATDLDIDNNADITYRVVDDVSQFAVDPKTGVVTTLQKLQCSTDCRVQDCNPNSCIFTVEAKDNGQPTPLKNRAYITVNLLDENDNDPQIEFKFFGDPNATYATVAENARNNSPVVGMSVTDPDKGQNGKTEARIISGNEQGHFRLQQNFGFYIFFVNGSLDREKTATYNLTIEATDLGMPRRTSSGFVIIQVTDENDHPPVFEKSSYSATLSELSPVGTFVASLTATDNDTDANALIQYIFVQGHEWFQIDPDTGLVTTVKQLDHAIASQIVLNVTARDSAPQPLRSFTSLTIDIWDENDKTPAFESDTFNVQLPEGSPAGTLVKLATAEDSDTGPNGTVTYSFDPEVQKNYPNAFFLHTSSGRVETRIQLNREVTPYYVIKVIAKDGGSPSLSSTATIYLNVTDINDNAPSFYPQKYYANVVEGSPVGTEVVVVTASDADAENNAVVHYSIVGGSSGRFEIGEYSGVITTTQQLNRLQKSSYTLSVSARDSGSLQSTRNAEVDIRVIRPEDNPPRFSRPNGYAFTLQEDAQGNVPVFGRRVGTVQISDSGNFNYIIASGDPKETFTIGRSDGDITNARKVDREEHDFYSLTVIASGLLAYGEVVVNISVLDVNDNAPVFPYASVDVDVLENWPVGHEVYLAQALDQDEGMNSQLAYFITPDANNTFTIEPTTGVVSLAKPVSSSHIEPFVVQITARDSGTNQKSSSMQLRLFVRDVNDHTPTFTKAAYETSVLESAPVNERFFTVAATDEDLGPNGEVIYQIRKGGKGKFGIFPDGVLYIAQTLDREHQDKYILSIMATDKGDEPRSSEVNITINVIDSNDNAPVFTNTSYNLYVPENKPQNTYVGSVSATDADVGRNAELTYMISTDQNNFAIDPKSGAITTMRSFDREEIVRKYVRDYISIEVTVIDYGVPRQQKSAVVNIFITDVNDNPPVFTRPIYEVSVDESAQAPFPLPVKVEANDLDHGTNGDVFYTIVDGNERNVFSIDRGSGQVTLDGQLDRETTPSYLLTVTAEDAGTGSHMTATTKIKIRVLDDNDNAPVFKSHIPEVNIIETKLPGEQIIQFEAEDADQGTNAQVEYEIQDGNVNGVFSMNSHTGVLYLAKNLDYDIYKRYTLKILAVDNGNIRRTSTTQFVVNVEDYNDNTPVFLNAPLGKYISENQPPSTTVVKIETSDADSGVNGEVRYSLLHQEPNGNDFAIDSTTGTIFTTKEIDRETTENFTLTVLAVDQAEPASLRRSAQTTVSVFIGDKNDNSPKFTSVLASTVSDTAGRNADVMTVTATDADSGPNGLVTYSLASGATNMFRINANTGLLTLTSDVSSSAKSYSIGVTATDSADPPRSTTETFTVILKSSNSNGPPFTSNDYKGQIEENKPVGTRITTLRAQYSQNNPGNIEYYVTKVTSNNTELPGYFKIDRTSGVLSTAEELDYEWGYSNFTVDVYAVDKDGGSPRTTRTQVSVALIDTNDTPPQFDQLVYTVSVSENTSTGSTVKQLTATDPDTNSQVTYRLANGSPGIFAVNSNTGTLTTSGKLDREADSKYTVVVEASDGTYTSSATVSVYISDINDNSPIFSKNIYSFDIPEDSSVGSTVARVFASDADDGANAEVTYYISSDSWGSSIFLLDRQQGIFTLQQPLDFEQTQHYILKVRAEDRGTPPRTSTATVYMNVKDLNDNAPIFDPSSYAVEKFENVPIGSSILTVSATDTDSGINALLVYSIISGDPDSQFSIHPHNGTVFTTKTLDREQKSLYSLTIAATDQALPVSSRMSTTTQVSIILKDVNDEAPVFTTLNETWVKENAPVDTSIMSVSASDADAGTNQLLEYSLAVQDRSMFSIAPVDGVLRVKGRLDKESQDTYTIHVTATDKGIPSLSTTQAITVHVLDQNDNNPKFDPSTYSARLAEDTPIGKNLLQVAATDIDEGLNGILQYFVVSGDSNHDFKLDYKTGVLSVQKKLDFERKNSYTLTVRAEDSSLVTRYDTAQITITITDINDNAPVFVDSPYKAYVQENMAVLPVPVVQISTRDVDSAPNGQVTYHLIQGDDSIFRVNSQTGLLEAVQALDREQEDRYELLVTAVDSGNPALTGTGSVTVYVKDVNDHTPTFASTSYAANIQEGMPVNTPVVQVFATDEDIEDNGQIRFSLEDTMHDRFSVHSTSGQISTAAVLDREEQGKYELVVIASDSASTPRSSSASVTVTVTDINDNSPHFEKDQYNTYIKDPTNTGDFVLGATALDPDIGLNGQITYTMEGSDSSLFRINSNTGVISPRQELRKSSRPNGYSFKVKAVDSGSPAKSDEANVRIQFAPAPPVEFPSFSSGLRQYTKYENMTVGESLTTVSALSGRSDVSVTYHIAGGNIGHAFAIDSTLGNISLTKPLDYEVTDSYQLYIEARDGGFIPLSTYILLTITVLDVNDNKPVFTQAVYKKQIMEEQQPGLQIARVQASDKDSGPNGDILYRIIGGNTNNAFRIQTQSGLVETDVKLDRETVSHYALTVEAVDQGTPQQTATCTVDVEVQDKNDNYPTFTTIFTANIPEDTPIGSFVIRITSSDPDIGPNAQAVYSFETPNPKFAIDSKSGNVTVTGSLDREDKEEYIIKVLAVDGSWRINTDLTIRLLDVNDNAPKFDGNLFTFNFKEREQINEFVGQVTATDQDADGPNSKITYALKFTSNFFKIEENSGNILTKAPLKYDPNPSTPGASNSYAFVVVARDHGSPLKSSSVAVVVRVQDANDHPPVFNQTNYFSPVPENAAVGDSVIQVTAIDAEDFNTNAEIEYAMVGGNGTNLFRVNQQTGWVTVRASLASHKNKEYVVIVKAQDKGSPPQSSQTSVRLHITGVNYNTPRFTSTNFQATIPEDKAVGSQIGLVQAEDTDDGLNGQIRYLITSGDIYGWFAIDNKTGVITVESELDYDSKPVIELNIMARDMGLNFKEISRIFRVILQDRNDNAPTFNQTHYNAYIQENSPLQTSIFTLKAFDRDSAPNAIIEYDILDNPNRNYFAINKQTGVITSKAVFNYEQRNLYTIEVMASNPNTDKESTTTVDIHVTGVNEFPPRFQRKQYTFEVSESAPSGSNVGSVLAIDEDSGKNGTVLYFLIGNSNTMGFKINQNTGEITVSKQLDRESASTINLRVLAKNPGSIRGNDTDTCNVTITLRDANDPPKFVRNQYDASVAENSPRGVQVIQVQANDNDLKQSDRQFTYHIQSGNTGNVFTINQNSGLIETSGAVLDRETLPVYNLTVVAADTGSPPQTGTTLVTVTLEDRNDNGPVFDPENVTGYVAENQQPGASVVTLTTFTTDPDLPPNQGPYRYTIVGQHTNLFAVGETTGLVTTKIRLDRESVPEYLVTVRVSDGGLQRLTSDLTFSVQVVDVNDSPSSPRPLDILVYAFQGTFSGMIGNVNPLDPDTEESSNYECQIIGSASTFSLPDRSCDLYTSLVQSPATRQLNISGYDGVHNIVYSRTTVLFNTIDNATLDNSAVVRLQGINEEKFLASSHNGFVSIIKNILNADDVVVYNLKLSGNDLDVYVAAKQSNGAYINAEIIRSTVNSRKQNIESSSGVKMASSPPDPCVTTPCKNNGVCQTHVEIYDTYHSASSPALVITSPDVNLGLKCSCPSGFSGPLCETAVTCGAGVCQNGGTCVSDSPTSWHCDCPSGFTGQKCENDKDECKDQPCNEGNCVNTVGSYRCELQGKGFYPLSYMEFESPLNRDTNNIMIEFATSKTDSLLLYNPGSTEYIALEIINGRVVFTFSLGAEKNRLTVGQHVSDGEWYRVMATREKNTGRLMVTRCDPVCGACAVTNGTCYMTQTLGGFENLDVSSSLYLGGIKSENQILDHPNQVKTHDFVGCIRNATVDGLNLLTDTQKRLGSENTNTTCPREQTGLCAADYCKNGGVCVDEWFAPRCQCKAGFMGDRCELVQQSFSFGPNAIVEYKQRSSYKRDKLLSGGARKRRELAPEDRSISLRFHTKDKEGLLFYVESPTGHTGIQIVGGKLVYDMAEGGNTDRVTISEQNVADSKWHNVTVILSGSQLSFTLDKGSPVVKTIQPVHDFLGLDITQISLGNSNNKDLPGYEGCISDFLLNGEKLPFMGSTDRFEIVASGSTSLGCPDALGCFDPCGEGETCAPDGLGNYSCVTQEGGLTIPVILVIVFFSLLLLGVIIAFVIFRVRREKKIKEAGLQGKENGSTVFIVNKGNDSNRSHQDSGYTESGDLPDEVIIQNHIAEELANGNFQERGIDRPSMQHPPDIIKGESKARGRGMPIDLNQEAVIIENGDVVNGDHTDFQEPLPEHYDIDNASSIAPSDIDVILHYKKYRHGKQGYRTNPHLAPSYHHKHTGGHRQSPNHILNRTARDSPLNLARQSPSVHVLPRESPNTLKMRSTPVARQSPMTLNPRQSPMPRNSPLTVNSISRQSPISPLARNSPMNQLSRHSPIRDMHASPLGLQFSNMRASPIKEMKDGRTESDQSSITDPDPRQRTPTVAPVIPNRPGTRLANGGPPIPPVGLTIEEIERLNARRHNSPVSTVDAQSSSTEGRNNTNHVEPSGLLEPPESSSEDSSNDSFTCSEFEYDNDKTRDFDHGMIFSKLAEVENENDDSIGSPQDSNRTFTYDAGSDSIRGSLSTLLVSEDETIARPKKHPNSSFNWDYLLNWGPSFEKLVGVFKDIAQLPDGDISITEQKLNDVKNDREEYV